MLLPIHGYGLPVLRKVGEAIDENYPDLTKLIEDMWDTMYYAQGVGLAAPQIGKSIRLFVVDTIQVMDEGEEDKGIKQVFINAEMIEETGVEWTYEEGCLSIPDVRGDVERKPTIKIRFQDENFETHEREFSEMNARVIQHEYDHIDGILFTELLKPIRKRLLKKRLDNIKKGNISVEYKMKFAGK
ncbi:MAG: peptide deformylase [Saprospiraceae bacterium]|nr:peptide deformylase [Saprospiraceae bacterium]MCB9326074.1 peptide deformylase [Lewinellaceae bacterium]